MSAGRKCRCPGLLLVVGALCAALPACGKEPPGDQRHVNQARAGQPENPPDAEGPQDSGANQAGKVRKLEIGECTLTGNFREFNDDALAVEEVSGSPLCLAADGMGGKVGGKVLGQVACQRAFEVLPRELKKNLPQARTPDQRRQVIRRAVVSANEDLLALAAREPDLRNLGATLVLAFWRPEDGLYVTGVGDSRVYLARGDKMTQLTVDHSLARALVEAGTITVEEARTHRFRNVLWKYLGTQELGDGTEVKLLPVQPQDRILLSTKGLHDVVPDERILRCLRQHADVQKCADALCQLALDSGSRSNVSCIVIEMVGGQ